MVLLLPECLAHNYLTSTPSILKCRELSFCRQIMEVEKRFMYSLLVNYLVNQLFNFNARTKTKEINMSFVQRTLGWVQTLNPPISCTPGLREYEYRQWRRTTKNLGVAEEQRLPRFSSKANSEQAAPKVQSSQGQDGAPPQILEENQQAP